jgi:DNA-binding FadR family transcriptional regulator
VGLATSKNLTFQCLEIVGRAIVSGEYEQGFPTEGELAKRLGASRTITREVVKMLTTKRLLTGRPRSGTAVLPESEWNLLDPDVLRWLMGRKVSIPLLRAFTEMRLAFEPMAAALAARKADQIDKINIQKAELFGKQNQTTTKFTLQNVRTNWR